MTAVFDEADEGVLLIDEAYALVRGSETDFGREAIDTIVKLVEDRRDRIVVIMAGYPDEMAQLVAANPGLRSRFPKTIHFPDYDTDELLAIFDMRCRQGGYDTTHEARRQGPRAPRRHRPRQGVRQRPRRPQPVRGGRRPPGLPHRHGIDEPTDDQLRTLEADDIPDRRPEAAEPTP